MIKVCYKCDTIIATGEKYSLYPLDKPYINLFFHTNCLKDVGDVMEFLLHDLKRLYKYVGKDTPKMRVKSSNVV